MRTLVARDGGTRLVVVDASTISDIDVTAGRMLGELQEELAARGVRLVVAEALRDVRELLVGDELKVDFTAADMYDTVDEAIASRRAASDRAVDLPWPSATGGVR